MEVHGHQRSDRIWYLKKKCRELSDIDGNFIPCFQSRIVKAFLDIFQVISWDLQVPAVPCSVVLISRSFCTFYF